jgi:hypothetical protein
MKTFIQRILNALSRGFVDFVSKPASPRPLAVMRIGVAGVLLLQAFLFAGNLLDLYGERAIVQWEALPIGPPPEMVSASWIRDLLVVNPDTSVQIVFYAYVASLVMLLFGWQTRIAAIVAWLTQMAIKTTGHTSIYGVDEFAHIALFYCVWMPVGNALSLDKQQGRLSDESTALARLALRVLQLHLCVVYVSSGIEKASGIQWWNGEAFWRSVMRPDLSMFDMSWLANYEWLAMAVCWMTLAVELGYGVMIWSRRTRPVWAALTIGMHLGIVVVLGLWTFGALMIALNVAALLVSPEPRQAEPVKAEEKKVKAARLAAV